MKLEEKIALLRKRNGWSQEELGFRLDVSRQAVSKWEMGDSVPDLDKILKMSEIFGCTTDYLLKDENESAKTVETEALPTPETGKTLRQVCDEEGKEYLALVKKQSLKIAGGVSLFLLSPVTMFILLAFSLAGLPIAEEVACGVGVLVLLVICAVGVVLIILGGVPLNVYEYLDKEEITISAGLEKYVKEKKQKENGLFTIAIAIGVALCILSVVPLLIFAFFLPENEGLTMGAVAFILTMVAASVFLFVKFGVVNGSYQKLLQEGDYTVKRKLGKDAAEVFSGIYWCLIVAVYLAVSFSTMRWDRTWIIWPVAGVAFALVTQIFASLKGKKG